MNECYHRSTMLSLAAEFVSLITGLLQGSLCSLVGVRCSFMVRVFAYGAMGCQSILPGGPIELFLILASAPQLV